MTGSGSPCGACKFLRRKCVRGCVFAPYFCHEQGAAHFSAIHRVFGASNVSKLLAHLPVSDRCEAAVTIAYEAEARLQDPIYGCVSHIFSLQQQVVNLQAQLSSLKEQAGHSLFSGCTMANPNERSYGKLPSHTQNVQSSFHSENSGMVPQFDPTFTSNLGSMLSCENGIMNLSSSTGYENSVLQDENASFSSFQEGSYSMNSTHDDRQWNLRDDMEDLRTVAFGYTPRS
ncbi:hypothetical protein RJ640_019618 [Escallonia rubra]|uniref:LOB domain-containing protein n=1 Tax=Escallonia rubra TaxID=112253 RepID=A0AA88R4J6_9ASTE|nr:hypothetical protein RJ640_019618 [Escallonia rubra]